MKHKLSLLCLGTVAVFGLAACQTTKVADTQPNTQKVVEPTKPSTDSQKNNTSSDTNTKPSTDTPKTDTKPVEDNDSKNSIESEINVYEPLSDSTITSPVTVTGEAMNTWFFEGTMPVQVLDGNGKVLGEGQAHATKEWTTPGLLPFEAKVVFSKPSSEYGTVRISNDNPSGLAQNSKGFDIGVQFNNQKTSKIKLYFSNNKKDPNMENCETVYSSVREVPSTTTIGKTALEELLKGPTASEEKNGFFNSMPSNVTLNSLTIANGVARADFDKSLEYEVSGSCRISAIIAQIEQTLLQFPSVKSVVISLDGETEYILQP